MQLLADGVLFLSALELRAPTYWNHLELLFNFSTSARQEGISHPKMLKGLAMKARSISGILITHNTR